jgi:dTDP-4-dehydrorhamnose reductase
LIAEKVNDWWGGDMPFPIPAPLAKFKTVAKRPKYSVLDPTHFNNTFQIALPDWREQFLRFFGGLQPNL